MNKIEKIEIKYLDGLDYSIKFHLIQEGRTFVKTVLSKFDDNHQKERFYLNSSKWRDCLTHWTVGVDEIISEDLGDDIIDHLLVTIDGKEIGLFDFVRYISDLE